MNTYNEIISELELNNFIPGKTSPEFKTYNKNTNNCIICFCLYTTNNTYFIVIIEQKYTGDGCFDETSKIIRPKANEDIKTFLYRDFN